MNSNATGTADPSGGGGFSGPESKKESVGDSQALKRAKRNEWDRERRRNETEEERQARLERRRVAQWKKLNEEPYNKIQQKKDRRNALERERRKSETPAERLERLARRKDYERKRRFQDSSDDGTGGGSASAGRATRPRLANNSKGKTKTAGAENPLVQVQQQQFPGQMPPAMTPLDFVLQQQRLQFLASSTSQQQQLQYLLPNMPSAITTGTGAAVTGAGGSGSVDSAQHLDQRAKRNEGERNLRKNETDEVRARRRAKRNESDRRRYKNRKESGGGGDVFSA